jgi:hypothetical protein
MDKELKTKLVKEILDSIPFIGSRVKEEITNRIIAIDEMDTTAQEAYVLADKIKEKKILEVKIAEAQEVLEKDVPKLEALIAELPIEVKPIEEPIKEPENPILEPTEPIEDVKEEEIIEDVISEPIEII